MVLSINLSDSNSLSLLSPSRPELEAEENPSKESCPSLPPNPLTWGANSVPSLSTWLATIPSCWSTLSPLCTGITSNSSWKTEFKCQLGMFLEKAWLFGNFGDRNCGFCRFFEMVFLGFERGRRLRGEMVCKAAIFWLPSWGWEELSWVVRVINLTVCFSKLECVEVARL